MIILILFAFISGIVTILSPCILPMLPIILSGGVGDKRKPYGVITGFILSFVIFSLTLSTIVKKLNLPPDGLRNISVIFIIFFGFVMLIPKLKEIFEKLVSVITRSRGNKKHSKGFKGGVLTGFSLGLIWTPCVGPIMASVISLAITQSVDIGSVFIILSYSIGTSIPMLLVILGGKSLLKKIPSVTRYFGIIMIVAGLSIAFGLDRKFQSSILQIFPNYGSGLTSIENIKPVQEALENRNKTDKVISIKNQPKNGKVGDYGMAPDFISDGEWLNSTGLTLHDLKGKVVIVDFWTYSCINCIRTIPYLKSWYETYKDDGLVIIGIHAPEFAFERSTENVSKAMKDLGVTWPVLLDNDYTMWQSYNNSYWPSKYFLDANGRIRYYHFGEGGYDSAEKVIKKLLKEAGKSTKKTAKKLDILKKRSNTPEIYLGSHRGSESQIPLKNGEWFLTGEWKKSGNYIEPENKGELELRFDAKSVNLVIEPNGKGKIEILIDGETQGVIEPEESRLYNIVNMKKSGEHTLRLKVEGKLRLFAFTFGG